MASTATMSASDPTVRASSRTGLEGRLACRDGTIPGSTAGVADGYVQGNLAVFPERLADDFRLFAERNPKPCPLIGESRPGRAADPGPRSSISTRHRRARLSRLARRRAGRGADGGRRPLARRPRQPSSSAAPSRSRRPLADGGCPCATSSCGAAYAMYRTNIPSSPAGPLRRAAGRLDAPAQAWRRRSARWRSRRAFRRVTARPSISAWPDADRHRAISPPRLWRRRCRSAMTRLPVFWACGVTPQVGDRGGQSRISRSPMRRAACSSPTGAIANSRCSESRIPAPDPLEVAP